MFAAFAFGESYFAEGPGVAVAVRPPNLFMDQARGVIGVASDLVIPVPELTAWIEVFPATVTLEALCVVPVPILTIDWAVFPPTSISNYAQKGNQAEQDEAQALLEHYMLTLAAWAKKGK